MCGPTLWLLGRLRKCLMYRACESRDGRVKDQYGVRGRGRYPVHAFSMQRIRFLSCLGSSRVPEVYARGAL